jgi:hypothetical protein
MQRRIAAALQNDILKQWAFLLVIGIVMQSTTFFSKLRSFHNQVSCC